MTAAMHYAMFVEGATVYKKIIIKIVQLNSVVKLTIETNIQGVDAFLMLSRKHEW